MRKLYALVAQCERQLGQPADALTTCRQGLAHYPDDAEILFQESLAPHDGGNLAGAIGALERVIGGSDEEHFASVDTGVRGYKARQNLATYYREAERLGDAETQWRLALAEQPAFVPALLGLGDLCLARRDQAGLQEMVGRLRAIPQGVVEAEVLQARGQLARQEFTAARGLLDAVIAAHPRTEKMYH